MATKMEITVRYRSLDRFSKRATFKTLEGARKFAHKWVGETPEVSTGFGYAVDAHGMGKVEWDGCTAKDLFPRCFPEERAPVDYDDGDYASYAADYAEDRAETAAYERAKSAGRHYALRCGCNGMTCNVCMAAGCVCAICGRDYEDNNERCKGAPPPRPLPPDDGLPF
jgi:hypothetical protein